MNGPRTTGVISVCVSLATFLAPRPAVSQEAAEPIEAAKTTPAKPAPGKPEGEPGMEDIDLFTLEVPVVVTATRREQKITTVPYAVSVITAEDIRRAGARCVPDALRLAAGVDVAELCYNYLTASPRGFHGLIANKTLVLVDGRQIFDVIFGGTVWQAWPFQLEDIQRIEVIRGPAGVTWGGNAVNGVINIITKDPADQGGLTVTGGGGSRGTHKEHLGYGLADDKLRLRISGEYEASDGFLPADSFLARVEDDVKRGTTGVHAVYEASPADTVTISGGSTLTDGGYSPSLARGLGVRKNPGNQASFALGKWAHMTAPDNRFELTGYVNDYYGSLGIKAVDYRYQQLGFLFSHQFKPADDHTITWGVDNRVDLVDSSNADPFMLSEQFLSSDIIGLYVQDEWQLAPRWTLDLGGRIDYDFYGGFQPSARASLSYELTENALLYGAVSRAFTMAPATARFLDIPFVNGLVRATADRDVDAQTLIAYEVGYRARLFHRLETSANLFWHEYGDVIALNPAIGPPGLVQMIYDNRGSASTYGLELDAEFSATKELTLLGHYAFEMLDWRSPTPFYLTEVIWPPKHKFMLGARYDLTDDLHLSSHLYYVDAASGPNPANPLAARHVDPYFRLDLRAEHEFWNDQASIAVGVRNLLDAGHVEATSAFLNAAEVPRMVYAEFRMTIR